MLRFLSLLLIADASLALIVQPSLPQATSCQSRSPASQKTMEISSRRAVLTTLGFGAAAMPLAAMAATLTQDEKELAQQRAVVQALDKTLKAEEAIEREDLAQLNKLEDATLKAMKKGDQAEVAALQAKTRAMKAVADDEEKKIVALFKEESKEVAIEQKELTLVAADEKAELAEENKELIQAEEAELKSVVDAKTASFISKFFK